MQTAKFTHPSKPGTVTVRFPSNLAPEIAWLRTVGRVVRRAQRRALLSNQFPGLTSSQLDELMKIRVIASRRERKLGAEGRCLMTEDTAMADDDEEIFRTQNKARRRP
jgi:hypothetical protein